MAISLNQVNDDNGFEAAEAEKINNTSQPSSSTSIVNGATATSTSPTTPNPLGNLSSSTYGLTLYMTDKDIINKFISGGGTMAGITGVTEGVRVVAQSGGFSSTDKTLTTLGTPEMPSVPVEYYIDDLNLTNILPGGIQKASVGVTMKFKIIEPYGFSFIQDLTRAGDLLSKKSKISSEALGGIQQHFIMGIKFYGYDSYGNVTTQIPSDTSGNSQNGKIFERFFAIRMTKVKFKLDGKTVIYNCEATIISDSIANGQIHGVLQSSTNITGSNVWDILANTENKTSLVSVLNATTQSLKDSGQVKIPSTYSIEFLDDKKNVVGKDSVIGRSKLINDATFDNSLAKTYSVSSAERSTIAQQFKAVSIDGNTASINQQPGQTLLTIIDNIITKSEYISSALNQIATPGAETNTKNQNPKQLGWYSINPIISVKDFDEKTNDWAYDIKFQISVYQVNYVRTVNATNVSTYNGPSKKYNYFLTGLNSEIISYEHQYDNLFYVMTVASRTPVPTEKPNTGNSPVHTTGSATGGNSNGSQNRRYQYNEEIAAQMYTMNEQGMSKIKIIGDPDYIMSTMGVNYATSLGKDKIGLDPLKGQVFVEVTFKMATDYNGNTGLLNVSGNIQFYNSQTIKDLKIEGVVFRVAQVDSVFSKGTFTQTLHCIVVDQSLLSIPTDGGSGTSADSGNQRAEPNQSSQYATREANLNSTAGAGRGGQGGPTAEELANASKSRIGATNPSSFDTRKADIVPVTSTSGGAQPINPKTLLPLAPSKNNGLGSGLGSVIKNNGQPSKGVAGASDDQFKATSFQLPDNRPRGGQ